MEYIIYSDESTSKGSYYSDFFGGALVTSKDWNEVNAALDKKKKDLNLFCEIKWTKVSVAYLEKYKQMMDLFFSFIKQNRVKLRIMFRDSKQIPQKQEQDMIANRYHLLYYQFIKHAFGLIYHDGDSAEKIYLKLFFDEISDSYRQNDAFRAHVSYLQNLWQFKKAHIVIRPDDIAEIDSHKHAIQQCMDIVLGAMAFHLNNMHLEIPKGQTAPGNKTLAKEELFQHILELIKDANGDPDFNVYETTKPYGAKHRWCTPYRHWKFVSTEFRTRLESE